MRTTNSDRCILCEGDCLLETGYTERGITIDCNIRIGVLGK